MTLFALFLASAGWLLTSVAWYAHCSVLTEKLRKVCPHEPQDVLRYYGDAAILKKERWVCTNCGMGTPGPIGPVGWEARYGINRERAT